MKVTDPETTLNTPSTSDLDVLDAIFKRAGLKSDATPSYSVLDGEADSEADEIVLAVQDGDDKNAEFIFRFDLKGNLSELYHSVVEE